MLKKVITSIIRKIIFLGIALGALIFIGYLASDRKDYPGKSQFEEANSKITTRSEGLAHGDSPESRAAAEAFATSMKTMQATLFTGAVVAPSLQAETSLRT